MNYLLLILAVFSLPLSAYAQDRNFPDDYHDITTDPQVGEPIKKVVDDEQEGAQTNFGTQQVHDDQIFLFFGIAFSSV